ncbi:MAG: T9SS type A sorting domain-containing protein, partial [Armatimonadetes bacterium]|nr:T9SS type A sorting domain-containing protein [Armatimonadota bacterium]
TVIRTTDGGEHWVTQHQDISYALFGVSFADSLTGLAVGNPPKLLGTTDGGATWDSIPTYFTSMLGVQMHDRQTATRRGITEVARSNDGGKTWRPLPLPAGVVPFRMSFWNARYGVVAPEAGGTLYYTNDSGQTWSAQESGLSLLGGAPYRMYGVSMIDSLRAIVVGPNGAILRFTKTLLSSSVAGENSRQQKHYCYPNPTTGSTVLRLPIAAATIALFDALGKEIGAERWSQQPSGNGEVMVQLKGLPAGSYFLRIRTHNGSHSVPVMLMP